MQLVDIDLIVKGSFTSAFNGLSSLDKEHAKLTGISEAVYIRTIGQQRYEIIGNPKAWYLAQAIQSHQIPVIKVDHLNDDELMMLSTPTTKKLGIIEQAEKVTKMLTGYKSKADLGRAQNMSRALVCNLVRIHAIADDIKNRISANPKIVTLGHAKVIAGLNHKQQNQILNEIINNGLSVHATEERAREIKDTTIKTSDKKSPEMIKLEQEISELIGCETSIDAEQGRVVIDYQKNIDVLDGVLIHLGYSSD